METLKDAVADLEALRDEIGRLQDRVSIIISSLVDGQEQDDPEAEDRAYYISVYDYDAEADEIVDYGRFGWNANGLYRAVITAKEHDATIRFHEGSFASSWTAEYHAKFFHYANDPRVLMAECEIAMAQKH